MVSCRLRLLLVFVALPFGPSLLAEAGSREWDINELSSPPHIVFILVDDLGWGNVGYHVNPSAIQRQREVQTPVMDRLAKIEGLELNRHYVSDLVFRRHFSGMLYSPVICSLCLRSIQVHHSCSGTRTSLQSGRFPVHVQTTLKNPEDPSSGTH